MPPRFAYWTILIDDKPTAFRARDQQELLPTLTQLKRTNQNVVLKWFAQGRLWDSPEAQRESWKKPKPAVERRGRDWRPGGDHKDPRARFSKEAQGKKKREQRAQWDQRQPSGPPRQDAPRKDRPAPGWSGKPSGDRPWSKKPPGERRPWAGKEAGGAPRGDRPWQTKPTGPRAQRKSWQHKPAGAPSQSFGAAGGARPWPTKTTR